MAQDKHEPGTLGQYKILTSSPAPAHGGSSAAAFWVQQKSTLPPGQGGPPSFIAFVGDRTSFFRTDIIEKYKSLVSPFIMRLLEYGVVDWADNAHQLAVVFQRPAGSSLYDTVIARDNHMSDGDIIGLVLPPVIKALKEMAAHDIVHAAIRPSNIYMGSNGAVILGECLSAAPGQDQPISLLTIERSLASPLGRGAGTIADDIYALGATLVSLAIGADPMADLDPQEAIAQKIARGSMWALKGRNHLSNSLYDLVRGMMDDNPAQRWTIDEIEQWINGRRTSVPPTVTPREAPRPLIIQGAEYWDPRSIADAFSRNVPEAMRLIGNDELIKWVRRTLRDITLAERIADAVNMPLMASKFGSYDSRLVARVVMALHPAGPIRYQNHSFMPDAFGIVLSKTLMAGESPQSLAEILVAQLPAYWFNIQPDFHGDHVAPMKQFEFARAMVEQAAIGGGIERCHYELSPTATYISEGFEKFVIRDAKQFLEALEQVAADAKRPLQPVTRQAAAFLAARDSHLGNRMLGRLAKATNDAEKVLGSLQILAAVQNHYNIEKTPNLCLWLETLLGPAIDRLHNRKAREVMRGELHKAVNTGSLTTMLATIENPTVYHLDREGLAEARREYNFLEIEKSILAEESKPGSHVHRSVGREAATIVAGILSVIATAAMVALQIGQTG